MRKKQQDDGDEAGEGEHDNVAEDRAAVISFEGFKSLHELRRIR